MIKFKYILIIILIFGCQSGSENNDHWGGVSPDLISAVDISYYPTISENETLFYSSQGNQALFDFENKELAVLEEFDLN